MEMRRDILLLWPGILSVSLRYAMFSKMAWVLTTGSNSLAARILRNNYGNFMLPDNRPRSNGSQFQRDLQKCKETFSKNCCKLIGKCWIPDHYDFKPIRANSNVIADLHLKVADLIMGDNWNLQLLNALFDSSTVNNILKFSISTHQRDD